LPHCTRLSCRLAAIGERTSEDGECGSRARCAACTRCDRSADMPTMLCALYALSLQPSLQPSCAPAENDASAVPFRAPPRPLTCRTCEAHRGALQTVQCTGSASHRRRSVAATSTPQLRHPRPRGSSSRSVVWPGVLATPATFNSARRTQWLDARCWMVASGALAACGSCWERARSGSDKRALTQSHTQALTSSPSRNRYDPCIPPAQSHLKSFHYES